ncbi:MAG: NAD(P)H-hydrate dehydratase [Deltaproteobacteria bacterium]|nr:NAD(P)H-hydrate dehydratase [Deltaproteobacteria bacterium]
MYAYTAEQVRAMDAHAIRELGIPGAVLMENAGRGAATLLARALAPGRGRRIVLACGPGNNGGDGFVMARHLANGGWRPELVLTRPPEEIHGDARIHLDVAVRMGIPARVLSPDRPLEEQLRGLEAATAVVDALFGTGLTRDLDPWHRALLRLLNATDAFRFAVDLPSGVHPDRGTVLGEAFRAHRTATFGAVKLGLVHHPGRGLAGEIFLVDISLSSERLDALPGVLLLGGPRDPPRPPGRPAHGHKHRFGHLLVVAGSPGKAGAAFLAGEAALRCGAGLCTVATRRCDGPGLPVMLPDLMVESLDMDNRPEIELARFVAGKTALAVGPGLGTCAEVRALVRWVVEESPLPRVLDADALTVLAGEPGRLRGAGARTVITPHPGELARLLAVEPAAIADDRLGLARRAADETGCITILKGAGSVIAAPDGRAAVCLAGSSALAKAGTGDVLTGLIGALLAQGMEPWEAACLGVWAHAAAGDRVARSTGRWSLLAGDLPGALGPVLELAASPPLEEPTPGEPIPLPGPVPAGP